MKSTLKICLMLGLLTMNQVEAQNKMRAREFEIPRAELKDLIQKYNRYKK